MKKTGKIMSVGILVSFLLLAIAIINSNSSLAQNNSGPDFRDDDRFRIDDRFGDFRDRMRDRMGDMGLMPSDMKNARVFSAILTGDKEVPAVNSGATGAAMVVALPNQNELMFALTVKDIQNVTASHIHLGQEGENGPVVVTLFPMNSENQNRFGMENEILAKGAITAADLSGPLQGRSINDLMMEIERGNAYVNVHTSQNPNGEIRDQLERMDMRMMDGMMNR